jgi:hypothetical protein
LVLFTLNPVAEEFEHRPNEVWVVEVDGSNPRLVIGGQDYKRELEWRLADS